MKILLTTTSFQDTPGAHHDLLKQTGWEIITARGPLNEADTLALVGDVDGYICADEAITRQVLENSRRKRFPSPAHEPSAGDELHDLREVGCEDEKGCFDFELVARRSGEHERHGRRAEIRAGGRLRHGCFGSVAAGGGSSAAQAAE